LGDYERSEVGYTLASGSLGSTPGIRLQSPKVVICIAEFIALMQPARVPRASEIANGT
jgi:hypothetical protein